jgi:tRNA (cytidine56-2'-O)-methyltransferase
VISLAECSDGTLPFDVSVLRLGHRLVRDERTSTHLGLVARAFGAKRLIVSGNEDETVESVRKVSESWGGSFTVEYCKDWRKTVKSWEGSVVHLTMYGEVLDSIMEKIRADLKRSSKNLLVIVGAEKVPREIYSLANYNVSVGSQPHSEIAALAVFLDRLFMGAELHTTFGNARMKIEPNSEGKKMVISNED